MAIEFGPKDPLRKCKVCNEIYSASSAKCSRCGEPNPWPQGFNTCDDKQRPETVSAVKMEDGCVANMEEMSEKIKITRPKVSLRDSDIVFKTPAIAKAFYTIEVIVSWIAALTVATLGISSIIAGGGLFGFGVCLSAAIGLVCVLGIAKLAYEMIVLFFEQLRVVKQIRDLLFQKMRD